MLVLTEDHFISLSILFFTPLGVACVLKEKDRNGLMETLPNQEEGLKYGGAFLTI